MTPNMIKEHLERELFCPRRHVGSAEECDVCPCRHFRPEPVETIGARHGVRYLANATVQPITQYMRLFSIYIYIYTARAFLGDRPRPSQMTFLLCLTPFV